MAKLTVSTPAPEALGDAYVRWKTNESDENFESLNKLVREGKKAANKGYEELKKRIRPICQRTLRRQVLAYVSYTNRHALVQEFIPNDDEKRLYMLVSEYLQSDRLYALPSSQRQLMTLILRKLLASSSYAIADTLRGLADKLEAAEREQALLDAPPPELAENFESLPEIEDEWLEDDSDDSSEEPRAVQQLSPEQRAEMRAEKEKLRQFHELATNAPVPVRR